MSLIQIIGCIVGVYYMRAVVLAIGLALDLSADTDAVAHFAG